MDKILVSQGRNQGAIEVTNDGATILKAIGVDNPAAKILVNMAKVQDDEVGDGTTSVTVLAAELLREAEKLVDQKIHPQTIIAGYRRSAKVRIIAFYSQHIVTTLLEGQRLQILSRWDERGDFHLLLSSPRF